MILKILSTGAGRTLAILVGSVLAVGLISYGLIQYGKSIQALETKVEQNERSIETRKRIDEAIRSNRSDDPDLNREWLRERNSNR